MKSIVKPSFYFSAYPLKAIKQQEAANKQPGSPYLRALLTAKSTSKPATKARVISLVNSNPRKFKPTNQETSKQTKGMELTQKEWFKNYE